MAGYNKAMHYNHRYLLEPILSSSNWDGHRYGGRNDGDKLSGIVYPSILLALYFTYIATLVVHSDGIISNESSNNNDDDNNSNQSIEGTIYRRHDVALHNSIDRGVWVIYDDGVYDITKFIPNHPGGQEKVLLAAGDDIAPYWKLYQQHFNSSLPMELLESMRIGSLHPDDVKAIEDAKIASNHNNDDPYANDPSLSKLLTYHGRSPINAESSPFLATDYWVTPIDLWFARNHHPIVVHLNENNYRLEVGWDERILPSINTSGGQEASSHAKKPSCSISLSLNELKTQFQPHTIISTLQCGGMFLYACILCMYICMFVYMYVCTHVCMVVCMHVRMNICMYYMYVRMYVYVWHMLNIIRIHIYRFINLYVDAVYVLHVLGLIYA
jgi:cytochrome b involved in lipid metabolism